MSNRKLKRTTPEVWHLATVKFPLHKKLDPGFLPGDEILVGRLDKNVFVICKTPKNEEWIIRKMTLTETRDAVVPHKKKAAMWRQRKASATLIKSLE